MDTCAASTSAPTSPRPSRPSAASRGISRACTRQSDKISHIDMEDDHIDTVISHVISQDPILISKDDNIVSVDNDIDMPHPITTTHISYRYPYRYLIDVHLPYRSPISILDHILSLWHKGDPAAEVYQVVDEVAPGGGRGGKGAAMGPAGEMSMAGAYTRPLFSST